MNAGSAPPLDIAHLIQLAVGPVFLLSGIGVTLGVFTTRLARIVDRARAAEQERESVQDPARLARLTHRLQVLGRRSRYISSAITLATLSALLVATTVVLLFANAILNLQLAIAIAVVFAASTISLTGALLVFLIEVRLATVTLRIDSRV